MMDARHLVRNKVSRWILSFCRVRETAFYATQPPNKSEREQDLRIVYELRFSPTAEPITATTQITHVLPAVPTYAL